MISFLLTVALGVAAPGANKAPNLVLLVADDLGNDYVGIYEEGPPERQPPTPNLDHLAREGVWFRNAYSNPLCSPTRATLQTGRYALRTGIGDNVKFPWQSGLDPKERTIAEVLAGAGYTCALVGKWHLGWRDDLGVGDYPPAVQGYDWFAGTVRNVPNYFRYDLYKESFGRPSPPTVERTYSTTELTDRAIDLVRRLPEPWFLVVTYHAPHRPVHTPPQSLHHYGGVLDSNHQFQAMVEALDTEIGRLLREVNFQRTSVLFLGDNGTSKTQSFFARSDYPRAKGTTAEAGINVPLIAAGYGVRRGGGESPALVNTTDLFATFLDLAGVDSSVVENDSVSFADVLGDPALPGERTWAYAEVFPGVDSEKQRDERTVRGPRFKLSIDRRIGKFEFHDLQYADQENRDTTLICRDADTAKGWQRCRARLDPEQLKEIRRLKRVLDRLDAERN